MSFKNKVVYQIYPQSYKDTNGDGIGDIQGIIQSLDYLQYLGIEMIWMNPIFQSPKKDNGYDITDYYAIDPVYGTMSDLEELIKEADKRHIGIMFDMVFNHTSITHDWFKKALKGDPHYQDYYFFKKNEGHKPTNWDSKFGGSCWEYVKDLDMYYLHLFDKTQADLNWENPEVRKELAQVVNFYLNKGIKGFRFDVINLISKDVFEDDYEGVGKRFYTDGKNVNHYLHELNHGSFGRYNDIMTVGEMSATSVEHCIEYTNPDDEELTMAFNFHHLKVDYKDKEKWTVMDFDFEELKSILNEWQVGMQEGNGWNALFWNCHDQPRSLSRFGDDVHYPYESASMLATCIHMMRGTPYVYQGEEIGMTNNYFETIEDYRDVESINYYHILKEEGYEEQDILAILKAKSRDNARSPMQWNAQDKSGFTTGTPWMKINENHKTINVESSLINPDSLLQYYRTLIQLRKNLRVISEGLYEPLLKDHPYILAYKRTFRDQELIVYCNFYAHEEEIEIDPSLYDILLSNYKRSSLDTQMLLHPYEALVLKRIH